MANQASTTTPTKNTKRTAPTDKPKSWGVERTGNAGATATLQLNWLWSPATYMTQRRARLAVLHRIAARVLESLDADLAQGCADPTVDMGEARGRVILELGDEGDYDRAAEILAIAARAVLA